jgi:hypothetical protein
MNESEIRELLDIGEEAGGIRFDDHAIKLITSFSCGSPYLASLLGQLSGLSAIDRSQRVVGPSDVANAVHVAVDEIEQRISEGSIEKIRRCFTGRTGSALARLARIAMMNGGRLDTVGKTASDMAAAECARAIKEIGAESGLLAKVQDPVEGRFQFVEEGLPTYICMLVSRDLVDKSKVADSASPE